MSILHNTFSIKKHIWYCHDATIEGKENVVMLDHPSLYSHLHTNVRTTYKHTYPYIKKIATPYGIVSFGFSLQSKTPASEGRIPWQYVTNHRQLLLPDWKSLQFFSYPAYKAIINKIIFVDVNGKCILHKDKHAPHSVFPLLHASLRTVQFIGQKRVNRKQQEKNVEGPEFPHSI
jgi:hypothetical protein